MNIFVILFGIYLLCGFNALIMILILTKQILEIADYFEKELPPLTDYGRKKGKRLLAFIVLCPILNLIGGVITYFIKPADLYIALDERGAFIKKRGTV